MAANVSSLFNELPKFKKPQFYVKFYIISIYFLMISTTNSGKTKITKMFEEKIDQLVKMLEKQELENSIQDPKLYTELLSCYLYLEDL